MWSSLVVLLCGAVWCHHSGVLSQAKHSSQLDIIKFLILKFSQLSGTPYGNLEDLYGSYDDNNEVAEEEEAIMKAPSFVSLPLDVVVNEGETIRLPCIVSRSVDIRASLLQY